MADTITLTLTTASAPFILSGSANQSVTLQLGPSLVGGVDLTGPSSLKGFEGFVSGTITSDEIIFAAIAPYSFIVSLSKSSATSLVAPAIDTILPVSKTVAGVTSQIGTITFASGLTEGVISFTNPNINRGDLIFISAPNPADTLISDITFLVAE